jgi:hypothetical protein
MVKRRVYDSASCSPEGYPDAGFLLGEAMVAESAARCPGH